MKLRFFVKMDGQQYGPYSLDDIRKLPLLDDTLVTADSLNGEWHYAKDFDFEDIAKTIKQMESSHKTRQVQYHQDSYWPQVPTTNNTKSINPDSFRWNWGAFALPWAWGIYNGLYWTIISVFLNFIPKIGFACYLLLSLYIGYKGESLAKKLSVNNGVDDVTFSTRQENWNFIGVTFLLTVIILAVFYFIFKNRIL